MAHTLSCMSKELPRLDIDPYQISKDVLRETVIADGGLEGLFTMLRDADPVTAETITDKYFTLLVAATSPEDTARHDAQVADRGHTSHDDVLNEDMIILASQGCATNDLPFRLVAYKICRTAFPEIAPEDIPIPDSTS